MYTATSFISQIEMLKDQDLIRKTVFFQRNHRSEAYLSLYRLFKSILREAGPTSSSPGSSAQPSQILLDHVSEAFDQLDQDREKKIDLILLPDLARLVSEKIGKQELLYLARICTDVSSAT
jgi:hypothetical protein